MTDAGFLLSTPAGELHVRLGSERVPLFFLPHPVLLTFVRDLSCSGPMQACLAVEDVEASIATNGFAKQARRFRSLFGVKLISRWERSQQNACPSRNQRFAFRNFD